MVAPSVVDIELFAAPPPGAYANGVARTPAGNRSVPSCAAVTGRPGRADGLASVNVAPGASGSGGAAVASSAVASRGSASAGSSTPWGCAASNASAANCEFETSPPPPGPPGG
jgi:hypothetical protein